MPVHRKLFDQVHMYGLEETCDTSAVPTVPLEDNVNTAAEMPDAPWMMYGVLVGSYVSVSVLKEIDGLHDVDTTRMQLKTVRQYGPNQRDKTGRDISGNFVLNDVAAALLFENPKNAARWIRDTHHVNTEFAPSLTWMDSERTNGGKLAVVDLTGLIILLIMHPKMRSLRVKVNAAYVQRECGAAQFLERAMQAATGPTLVQQILQRGSRMAIPNGPGQDEVSESVNADGDHVVERLVKRAVVLPGGQGVQIQQVVQRVVSVGSELDKRSSELRRVELKRDNLKLAKEQLAIKYGINLKQPIVNKEQPIVDKEQPIVDEEQWIVEKKQRIVDLEQQMINLEQQKIDLEQQKRDNMISAMENFEKFMEMLNGPSAGKNQV